MVATAPGTVALAGRSGRYGKVVVIGHGNGYKTCYAHLSTLLVREGEPVSRGHRIGRVGKSGNATGYLTKNKESDYGIRKQEPGLTL